MTARTEAVNAASQRVMEKRGFKRVGEGKEGILWEKEKPASAWMSVYLCIGLSVGLSLGLTMDQMATGMCIGLAIGVALGVSLDEQDKKKRRSLKEARQKEREGEC
jgi:hypothetical protein